MSDDKQKPPVANKKATIQDVAALAGVSGATVSYIMSGRRGGSRISAATRQRVEAAARQLGYTPNTAARNLRRQRTDCIAVAIPILAPYNAILVEQLQKAADKHGHFAVVVVAGSENRELQTFNELRRGLADAAVIKNFQFLDVGYFRQLADTGLALVVMDEITEPDGFDVVRLDEAAACAQAVELLLAKGHIHFALMGNLTQPSEMRKAKRYLHLLHARGMEVDPRCIRGDIQSRRDAYGAVQTLAKLEPRPTALLAVTDRIAIGALLGARMAGLQIPDDLAILGIGNIPEGEITTPPLSTIGQRALDFTPVAEALFRRLSAATPPAGRRYDGQMELIERGTT